MDIYLMFRSLLLTSYLNIVPYEFENNLPPLPQYDFIVVGAGAAGSVVAGRLAETEASVLVLEAGPSATVAPETVLPEVAPYLSGADIVRRFEANSKPQTSINAGHLMGGGTSVNGMVFLKGSRGDFNHWAALGNYGWDYDSVLYHYKNLETFTGQLDPSEYYFYGTSGPVTVTNRTLTHERFKANLETTAQELGFNYIDPSHPDKIGISLSHMNAKNGARASSSEAFLKPVAKQENILIKTNSPVTKILFDKNRRAVGVQYMSGDKATPQMKVVRARKEVIISAGAVTTPKLLMLSGVGPKDHLKDLGIEVVAGVDGVGRNLKEHPFVPAVVWNMTNSHMTEIDGDYAAQHMKTYNKTQTGPISEARFPIGHVYANVNDEVNPSWPDIFMSLTIPDNTFQIHTMMSRPKSSGRITLKSSSFLDDPLIDLNFLEHPDDIKTLIEGVKLAFKVGNSHTMTKFHGLTEFDTVPPECRKFTDDSDSFWECFVRKYVQAYSHPAGTCKMSPSSDPLGVVSPTLKLRGVTGVRIADASIMPQVVSINPTNTIMMIGEKAAHMIKQDWGLREKFKIL